METTEPGLHFGPEYYPWDGAVMWHRRGHRLDHLNTSPYDRVIRQQMEFERFYLTLNRTYCSRCGMDSTWRTGLVSVLRHHARMPDGQGWVLCSTHLREFSGGVLAPTLSEALRLTELVSQ
jgi:hypothetical protein